MAKRTRLAVYQIERLAKSIASIAFTPARERLAEERKPLNLDLLLALYDKATVPAAQKALLHIPAWLTIRATTASYNWFDISEPESARCGQRFEVTLPPGTGLLLLRTEGYNGSAVEISSALHQRLRGFIAIVAKLNSQESALVKDLQAQITVLRYAEDVLKTWPEVTPALKAMFADIDNPATVVTPLSALLGKYLPSLPAPRAA